MTYINALTSTLRSRCVLASAALAAAAPDRRLRLEQLDARSRSATRTEADNALATQTETAAKRNDLDDRHDAHAAARCRKSPTVTPPPPPPPKKLVIQELIVGTGAEAETAASR